MVLFHLAGASLSCGTAKVIRYFYKNYIVYIYITYITWIKIFWFVIATYYTGFVNRESDVHDHFNGNMSTMKKV